MKNLKQLIEWLENEIRESIPLEKRARCDLDEGFFNGLKTAYKNVLSQIRSGNKL
jgi:hypothetical protein